MRFRPAWLTFGSSLQVLPIPMSADRVAIARGFGGRQCWPSSLKWGSLRARSEQSRYVTDCSFAGVWKMFSSESMPFRARHGIELLWSHALLGAWERFVRGYRSSVFSDRCWKLESSWALEIIALFSWYPQHAYPEFLPFFSSTLGKQSKKFFCWR
jgi:hypothetical protein